MRDNRSQEIKRILKKTYPDNQFKVRCDKYSMGESFRIYTDLIKELPNKAVDIFTEKEKGEHESTMHWNQVMREIIERQLKEFWHIDRDEFSGEILTGGNTFLFVEPWSGTKWL